MLALGACGGGTELAGGATTASSQSTTTGSNRTVPSANTLPTGSSLPPSSSSTRTVPSASTLLASSVPPTTLATTRFGQCASGSAATDVPTQWRTWPRRTAVIDGVSLPVVLADCESRWVQGMRGITNTGAVRGVLFDLLTTQDVPVSVEGAAIDVDVAFFDAKGVFLIGVQPERCSSNCKAFSPSVVRGGTYPYRWVIIAPRGTFPAGIKRDVSTLTVR